MHVNVMDKRWNLRFVKPMRDCRGKCFPPDESGKEIRVNRNLEGQERLEVILHELLHAANWHLDESFVEQCAADISKILWKLGYRCV